MKKPFSLPKKNRRREPMTRVFSASSERMPGFCPVCAKPVDVILSGYSMELFGICSECGSILFYSNKLPIQGPTKISNFDNLK